MKYGEISSKINFISTIGVPRGINVTRKTNRIGHTLCVILAIIFSSSGLGFTQGRTGGEKIAPHTVPMTTLPIKVDGSINESAWDNASAMELKYEFNPGDNVPAPVKTEFLMIYNKSHLYVAFRCFDPNPGEIRAHLSDHDRDYGDDFVGILLDTFNDERKNYIFLANPLGAQQDAIMTGQSGYNSSWDARFKSAGKVFDWGYSVEMAIPFSSLRFQRTGAPQVWGIDARRHYPRNVYHKIGLVPQDRNNNCYQCQMLKVRGFEGIRPGRNVEITPTVTGVRTDARDKMPNGKMKKSNEDAEVGVTARWGVTPNVTVGATVNPDFSQVEADAWKLDINEPFALSYDEKRPFFTEGSEYFSTSLDAVYTRTLRDPVWGLKLTGKEGNSSMGAYVIRDAVTNIIFPGSEFSDGVSLDMGSTASVFRYKHDFGSKYTVGALFTNRQGTDYYNRVFGVDGVFRFTKRDRLEVELLASSTRYPDEIAAEYEQKSGRFNDKAIRAVYSHNTRNLTLFGAYLELGDDFRADLGHIPRVGYREFQTGGQYRWIAKPGKWWSLFLVEGSVYQARDYDGKLLFKGIESMVYYSGVLQSTFYVTFDRMRETYYGREFDLTFFKTYFDFRPVGDLYFALITRFGDRIDYSNIRPGRRFRVDAHLRYSLGNHLRLNLQHTYERMRAADQPLYTANISQGTIIYQFNTRTFFRSILQYVDYDYNTDNFLFSLNPEYRRLFVQLLFSYKLNPRTVLFLGYTDNYRGNQNFPITRSDRTFFLKLGYAWQF